VTRKPPIAQRNQLEGEMRNTIGLLLREKIEPVNGLGKVQTRQERTYARSQTRWNRVAEARREEWSHP